MAIQPYYVCLPQHYHVNCCVSSLLSEYSRIVMQGHLVLHNLDLDWCKERKKKGLTDIQKAWNRVDKLHSDGAASIMQQS